MTNSAKHRFATRKTAALGTKCNERPILRETSLAAPKDQQTRVFAHDVLDGKSSSAAL